jgi:hypothetical protein
MYVFYSFRGHQFNSIYRPGVEKETQLTNTVKVRDLTKQRVMQQLSQEAGLGRAWRLMGCV